MNETNVRTEKHIILLNYARFVEERTREMTCFIWIKSEGIQFVCEKEEQLSSKYLLSTHVSSSHCICIMYLNFPQMCRIRSSLFIDDKKNLRRKKRFVNRHLLNSFRFQIMIRP